MYTREKLAKQYQKKKKLKFIFFWKPKKTNVIDESCLSQWYPSSFVDGTIVYKTAEHYMMAEKAKLFDPSKIKIILEANTTKQVKSLGRSIKNFDEKIWQEKSLDIVNKGNYLKFSQNKDIKKYLLSTHNKILVEASPYDKIWGVGMDINNENIKNPLKWKGENKLGFALMEVRKMLLGEKYGQYNFNRE